MKKKYEIVSDLKSLDIFVLKVLHEMNGGGVLLLRGNLASGKTSFVKSFVKQLGIPEAVSSPTFSILNEYDRQVFHYDIYQCGIDGFLKSGLMEKLEEDGYHLIEWGEYDFEMLLKHYGMPYSTLDIEIEGLKRRYKVTINA